ncbi:MAG: response regulator [Proteobacteria bacterium]|nr:response regulator [Pseudomonadota bacterium]
MNDTQDIKARILILVDDNQSSMDRIVKILQTGENQILKAGNGVEGIRSILRYHPDALIINQDMEYLDGLQMVKLLNAIGISLPVLLVNKEEKPEKRLLGTLKSQVQSSINKLASDLNPLIDELLEVHKKSYRDISYSLSQSEFMGLLARSDRKKILIVTEPFLRKTLIDELTLLGTYELYFAYNVEDALYKSVFFQPDLILSEIDFSEGDGIQLAQNLYILGHPFPIIFISERSDMDTITRVKKLDGIQGYLLKNELIKNIDLLHQHLDGVFNLSKEEKERVEKSYRIMEPEKLQISKSSSENIDFKFWLDDLE